MQTLELVPSTRHRFPSERFVSSFPQKRLEIISGNLIDLSVLDELKLGINIGGNYLAR